MHIVCYKKSEQAAADCTAEANEKEQQLKDKIEDLEEALSSEKDKNDKHQKVHPKLCTEL